MEGTSLASVQANLINLDYVYIGAESQVELTSWQGSTNSTLQLRGAAYSFPQLPVLISFGSIEIFNAASIYASSITLAAQNVVIQPESVVSTTGYGYLLFILSV